MCYDGSLGLFISAFQSELEWVMFSVLGYDTPQGYAVLFSKSLGSLRI